MAEPNDLHSQIFVSTRVTRETAHTRRTMSVKVSPSKATEPLGVRYLIEIANKKDRKRPVFFVWHPHGESNPGFSRERAAS